jgi:ribosomal-protein-alanine N-acetyltransferase
MSAQLADVITYRRFGDADLDAVSEIERAVHPHPWTRGNFADSIEAGYHCWIAQAGQGNAGNRVGGVLGYCVVMVAAGEAHLLNLSVAPQWQRRGVGAELTRFCVKLARDYGAERIFLEVRPSNAAARLLYGRTGFSEVGVRRDYYPASSGREDAIVMELKL